MTDILLEVCVEDIAGLKAAIAGGADRIELCSALALGGLTPSAGLIAAAAEFSVPSYAMIRPRAGDFRYSQDELEIMRCDIDAVRQAGLAGVVFGATGADGRLDAEALDSLARAAGGRGMTLHRAFDLVPDFAEAVETAIAIGFERILTSGGALKAQEGILGLAATIAAAGKRISIMPGSGVNLQTVDDLLARLNVSEIHSSCSVGSHVADGRAVAMGFAPSDLRRTDAATVRALKRHLQGQRQN
jgi:copper homeostasis protein